jgi:hypothetical protein
VAKVYLETSFFSACVSTRMDPKTSGWRVTSNEWWETEAKRHELFISAEVVRELAAPSFPNRSKAMEMIRQTSVLALSDDVIDFAEILVNEKVMPGPATEGDALHVAAATIHGMEYVLTWNVRHLANPKKRTHFGIICMRLGLVAPMLITADLLQEADDE